MNAQTKIEAAPEVVAPAIPAVYTAINGVMRAVAKEGLAKDKKNQQQGYKFRGIDDVYNLLCGILAENNLVILPDVEKMEREERQTQKGGTITYTLLTVRFKLVSALDGSFDYVRTVGEAMDSADKSANKAQSAAMKYAELQVFQIPTEGDNDADATTHDLAARNAGQADRQQNDRSGGDAPKRLTQAQWSKIVALLEATKVNADAILKHFNVGDLKKLTDAQAIKVINQLEDKLAALAKAETNRASEAQSTTATGEFDDLDADSIPY